MALRHVKRILAHLSHDSYEPQTVEQIAEELRIEDDPDGLAEAVETLKGEHRVTIDHMGRLRLPSLDDGAEVIGTLKTHPKGFGFVTTRELTREGDVFIPPNGMNTAMNGDVVRLQVRRDKRRPPGQQFSGQVIEVMERKRSSIVGTMSRRGSTWLLQPDGKRMNDPIVVRDAESKNVKEGDKAAIEIVEYAEHDLLAEGVIVKVLGEAGKPDVETQSVIEAFGLPGEFPDACMDEARRITDEFHEQIERFENGESLPMRKDLTETFICTIDPPDAKDYDDAISIRRTDKGWELGVHIADVGHFVERGGDLDKEAYERGNSVYLPRLVIPMLPELLSNGICSLQEGVARFAKSAFMSYDRHGNVRASGFSQSIIKSAKRMTYLEAQALIDGDIEEAKKHAKTDTNYSDELISTVKEMDALARAIRQRRERFGMISLELPDAELVFDENGRVIDAVPEDDAFTHTIIEMFMVEANEAVARLFENIDVPLLRRIHPEPLPADTEDLRQIAMVAGFRIPKNPEREELQSLLNATRGTPAARAVHMAVLRTLTRAEYSPALIGHFALASASYAHFTSPIRRYPDLTVHRSLGAYLERTDNGENPPRSEDEKKALGKKLNELDVCPSEGELVMAGRHCTGTEENAEEAERDLRQFLVLQLLSEHVGESFPGVITGVTPRGVFVQLDKYLADGMIDKSDLPGDVTRSNAAPFWKIDKRTGALVDSNSGRSFAMGDRVEVTVAEVSLEKRQMELLITDPEARAAGKAKAPTLKLGSGGGGLGSGGGAGFGDLRKSTGGQRRSRKSKQRDKGKKDYRRDKKK